MQKKTLFIIVLLIALVTITGTKTSFAEESVDKAPVIGKMELECHKMSDKTLDYAQKQGWCLNKSKDGPNTTNTGSCGTVFLDVKDEPSSSQIAEFNMFIWSSKGAMANVNYNVSWLNITTGIGNSFGGSEWPWASNWGKLTADETGNGSVSGNLTGVVTLWWGGTCAIIPTNDYGYIN